MSALCFSVEAQGTLLTEDRASRDGRTLVVRSALAGTDFVVLPPLQASQSGSVRLPCVLVTISGVSPHEMSSNLL